MRSCDFGCSKFLVFLFEDKQLWKKKGRGIYIPSRTVAVAALGRGYNPGRVGASNLPPNNVGDHAT
jgi:hypothetical protein